MAESASFPELELIDSLIAGVEALITESDETPFYIDMHQAPRKAFYRIFNSGIRGQSDKRIYHADAVFLNDECLILRCNDTSVVKQMQLHATVQAEKSSRGEVLVVMQGKVRELKRIQGGYDVEIEITETRKIKITPAQKLRDCILHNDVTGWNRWCNDIPGSLELTGTDMRMTNLSGYDLCLADFTGSDFTGANLSGAIFAGAVLRDCVLENVTVTGTDFFHARMNRSQAALLQQSGMPEIESVVFDIAE